MLKVKLTLIQQIRLLLFGKVKTRIEQGPRFNSPTPFYAFICPDHGLVENYPRGWYRRWEGHIPVNYRGKKSELRCPVCTEERLKYA